MPALATVQIKCPQCQRFLAEVAIMGRAVCQRCGWEIAVWSKEARGKPEEVRGAR
jgi:hypothetical protein